MDIKEAFHSIRYNIDNLNQENSIINSEIDEIKFQLKEICVILEDLSIKIHSFIPKNNQISYNANKSDTFDTNLDNSTNRQINQTLSTHNSTHNIDFKPLNDKYLPISIGNEGVSTDRQTNRQTDKYLKNHLSNASELIDSLDSIKKELRLKFKRLTSQEILIFSALYQIEEEIGIADYKSISKKTNLTESSIRDYIRRLIIKGIPINKTKINNKSVQLSISSDLKKIASLSTIMQLIEL